MKAFLLRLQLAFQLLRAKKFVVFLPDYERSMKMEMKVRGREQLSLEAWNCMFMAVGDEYGNAVELDVERQIIEQTQERLLEQARILSQPRQTPDAESI